MITLCIFLRLAANKTCENNFQFPVDLEAALVSKETRGDQREAGFDLGVYSCVGAETNRSREAKNVESEEKRLVLAARCS